MIMLRGCGVRALSKKFFVPSNQKVSSYFSQKPRLLSSAVSTAPHNDDDDTTPSGPDLYMWGTDETDTSCTLLKTTHATKVFDRPFRVEHLTERFPDEDAKDVDIDKVICGPRDTAFLLKNGCCYVTGHNKHGMLGVGQDKSKITQLTKVTVPSENAESKITQVSLGTQVAAFVDEAGDLYTSGFGGSVLGGGLGILGLGASVQGNVLQPHLVSSLVEDGCRVAQVQVSEEHMTVLTKEGEVLSTGSGSYGRLGNFDIADQAYLEPVEVLSEADGVIQIAGGRSFTLALTREGVIYSWGKNDKGQLGTGLGLSVDIYAMQSVPEPIEADELVSRRVIKIAAGRSHSACVTKDGLLFHWGMSLHFDPVLCQELVGTKIVDVVCGEDYTLAVDDQGKMYALGIANRGAFGGTSGVLGQGPKVSRLNVATKIEDLDLQDKKVKQVSAGWKHVACLLG